MKLIARNKHLIGKASSQATVIAFNTVTTVVATAGTLTLDKYWKSVGANPSYELLVISLILSLVSAFLLNCLGFLLTYLIHKVTLHGWPHYYIYIFQVRPDEYIIGWFKIDLDRNNKHPVASGCSYSALPIDFSRDVKWISKAVAGGSFHSDYYCYILYDLNEGQADKQGRLYREGMMRLRLVKENERELGASRTLVFGGKDRYIGWQQAVDGDSELNFVYAEQFERTGYSPRQIEGCLVESIEIHERSLIQEYKRLCCAQSQNQNQLADYNNQNQTDLSIPLIDEQGI
jgi:hypothetical protein